MINREVTTCHATSLAKKILKILKFLHELVMIKTFYLKKDELWECERLLLVLLKNIKSEK
jgi:hypothetical protein